MNDQHLDAQCLCGRTIFTDDYSEMQKCPACHCVVLSKDQIDAIVRKSKRDKIWDEFYAGYRTEKHDVGFDQKPMEH